MTQRLEGVERAGQGLRGQILSKQDVNVEHRVSVASGTSREEKWLVGGRDAETTKGKACRGGRAEVTMKGNQRIVVYCVVYMCSKHVEQLFEQLVCCELLGVANKIKC